MVLVSNASDEEEVFYNFHVEDFTFCHAFLFHYGQFLCLLGHYPLWKFVHKVCERFILQTLINEWLA
jgi:hypothetical protein